MTCARTSLSETRPTTNMTIWSKARNATIAFCNNVQTSLCHAATRPMGIALCIYILCHTLYALLPYIVMTSHLYLRITIALCIFLGRRTIASCCLTRFCLELAPKPT